MRPAEIGIGSVAPDLLDRRHRDPRHATRFQHAATLAEEAECLAIGDMLDDVLGEDEIGAGGRERQRPGDVDLASKLSQPESRLLPQPKLSFTSAPARSDC
jgi:hypothetical protein